MPIDGSSISYNDHTMKPKIVVPKIGFPSDYENLTPKHQQILDLSEQLLGTLGVTGLELKSIAKKLDVSPSLINHYYKATEILVFDTVIYSYQKTIKRIQAETEFEKNPEIVARSWIREMLHWTTNYPGVGVLLEFPRGALRSGGKATSNSEAQLTEFMKIMSQYGASNVAYMCSSVRALQKGKEFKPLSPVKVASFIATDSKFAMYVSLMGFSTIGGGLWIAGRRPSDSKNSFWRSLGFNPIKQIQSTIDEFLRMIKAG